MYQPPFVGNFHSRTLGCGLRVEILDEGLVRVGYEIDHVWDSASDYGVSPDFIPGAIEVKSDDHDEFVELRTQKIVIGINKVDLRVTFSAAEDRHVLCEDVKTFSHELNPWTGEHRQRVFKKIKWNELYFGLGDKPCMGNLRGRKFEFWGSDHYAFREDSDPLYKNIPFFMGLADQRCYGLFLDNTAKCSCDFGKEENNTLVLDVPGGRMDYFFFYEDSPIEIAASYTRLTGLADLPPMWALGYQQSRWSYYPESVVLNVVERMRESRIPCDAIYLDIHHLKSNCSFTWDGARFPDPAGMIERLAADGIKLISIVNPGIKIDRENEIWKEGMRGGHYCRRHDGAFLEGSIWGNTCHFPDFTDSNTRSWWSGLFEEGVGNCGISGIWADMNEPSISPDQTFPLDTRHDCDGHPCSHAKAHNIYGHCMAEACREGMVRFGGGKRPFVLTRSGYAGLQRYAATWTGDNCSSWDHLAIANVQCQRLSISGVSFCGADVGGFLEYPTQELFCRWMQLGAFHVLFRNHSSGDYGGQEPWNFGDEITSFVRDAVEWRYRLLPYFYTQFHLYSCRGVPVIRPLALQCVHERDTNWRKDEFFVGDHVYVVPVLEEKAEISRFYAPLGRWYSLWDDSLLVEEGEESAVELSLEKIPVFVRGGAVIPLWPVQQYVGQTRAPDLSLHLWWAPQSSCLSGLYEDAGDGQEYRKGDFLHHHFTFESGCNDAVLSRETEGAGGGFHDRMTLVLHAFPADARTLLARIDGAVAAVIHGEGKTLIIPLPDNFGKIELSWDDRGRR